MPGYINTDFADVYNTLKNGHLAIMNVGQANGENRITRAINAALQSPLVNNDVRGAKRILLQFYCSTDHAIIMQEIDQINAFIAEVGDDIEVNWGATIDDSLDEDVRVTIIATGYEIQAKQTRDDNYPVQPITPEQPETPESPEFPEQPETPDQPESPETPDAPEEPEHPSPTFEIKVPSTPSDEIQITLDDDTPVKETPARTSFGGWMRGRR